jgi:hypothetical protein
MGCPFSRKLGNTPQYAELRGLSKLGQTWLRSSFRENCPIDGVPIFPEAGQHPSVRRTTRTFQAWAGEVRSSFRENGRIEELLR